MSSTDGMTEEQQHYLQGFVSGTDLARSALGLPTFARTLARNGNGAAISGPLPATAEPPPGGPEAIHRLAQDRVIAEGKKLCPEEEAKRKKNALDLWDELRDRADKNQYP